MPGYAKGFRTLYGHFSSIKRVALTLGLPLKHDRKIDIVQRYHHRMQNLKTLPPRFVKDGPVLPNVLDDVNQRETRLEASLKRQRKRRST